MFSIVKNVECNISCAHVQAMYYCECKVVL